MSAALRVLATVWLLLLAAPGAGAPVQETVRCKRCDSSGREPCPEHPEEECAFEDEVLYCSVALACPVCRGAGFVDCERCENPASDRALEERRARAAERAAAWQHVDDEMGRPLRKAESANFLVVWEMHGLKVDKKRRNEHWMLHLTLRRLERLREEYLSALQADPQDFARKSWVLVWHREDDHRDASLAFVGLSGYGGNKLMGADPRYSVCGSRRFFRDDEALHRNLVHMTTHLLFSHEAPSRWIGNLRGGWAEEGLAHWFEERLTGLCTNYCYEEVDANRDFKGGKFKPALRKLVAIGEAPPLAGLMTKNTDALTLPEHALALAVVDYLLQLDGAAFDRVGKRLRAKESTRDALKEEYGLGIVELQARLFEWVLETYPRR